MSGNISILYDYLNSVIIRVAVFPIRYQTIKLSIKSGNLPIFFTNRRVVSLVIYQFIHSNNSESNLFR